LLTMKNGEIAVVVGRAMNVLPGGLDPHFVLLRSLAIIARRRAQCRNSAEL
jgi:hypothetical protein